MPLRANDPKHWRECAEECRVLGDMMTDPGAKNTMFEVAAAYDKLAATAEGKPAHPAGNAA